MVEIRPLALPDVLEIRCRKFSDARGSFAETYSVAAFAEAGLATTFVQDNHSVSVAPFTLRGLHYQTPPFAQDKLVRVLKGRILDVALDIRHGSPTYRQWVALEVSVEGFNQILVPKGFAHGFLTLEPDTEVLYKVSAPYAPAHDCGIAWNDPAIGIDWPLAGKTPVLSQKDAAAPLLADAAPAFFSEDSRAP